MDNFLILEGPSSQAAKPAPRRQLVAVVLGDDLLYAEHKVLGQESRSKGRTTPTCKRTFPHIVSNTYDTYTPYKQKKQNVSGLSFKGFETPFRL